MLVHVYNKIIPSWFVVEELQTLLVLFSPFHFVRNWLIWNLQTMNVCRHQPVLQGEVVCKKLLAVKHLTVFWLDVLQLLYTFVHVNDKVNIGNVFLKIIQFEFELLYKTLVPIVNSFRTSLTCLFMVIYLLVVCRKKSFLKCLSWVSSWHCTCLCVFVCKVVYRLLCKPYALHTNIVSVGLYNYTCTCSWKSGSRQTCWFSITDWILNPFWWLLGYILLLLNTSSVLEQET